MKKILIMIVVGILALSACKKSEIAPKPSSVLMFDGGVNPPIPPGPNNPPK